MNQPAVILVVASVFGAAALALLLPKRSGATASRQRIALGVVVAACSLGLFVSRLPWLADVPTALVFYPMAGLTLLGAVGTVSSRKPVYSAVWFGLVLLSTAGLLLVQGAQFLAVATIVVYAGAILVTFLFVLMLAVPEGRAGCDRTSYEAVVSAAVGAVIVGVLAMAVGRALDEKTVVPPAAATTEARAEGVLGASHVARFGPELFGRHLVAIEVAGALLLAALVGAAAVAGTRRSLVANETKPQMNADEHR